MMDDGARSQRRSRQLRRRVRAARLVTKSGSYIGGQGIVAVTVVRSVASGNGCRRVTVTL
eukprot:7827012-Pyramimonas_sp.AAC.1